MPRKPRLKSQREAKEAEAAAPAPRLSYRPDELAKMLGVSRKTVDRRIKDNTLRSKVVLGVRLIDAESVKEMIGGLTSSPA